MLRVIALSVTVALAAPVVAGPAATPAPAQQPAAPVKEKKICREEAVTGSIMPKRTCHTQAEWDALGQLNREALEQLRERQKTGQTVGQQ